MFKLSHRLSSLSMLALLASSNAAAAAAAPAPAYVGRWTVSDAKPVYSSRGILYKTFDIAPCGRDFCGVSVGQTGACGPLLFRFLATSIRSGGSLIGHGRWGETRKNIELYQYAEQALPGGRMMGLSLGDGHDFGERSGNMPKFTARYRPLGAARCVMR